MTAAELTYTVKVGALDDGTWWARFDGKSYYSMGSGEDAWSAVLDATREAHFVIEDEARLITVA
jgi:hypothetical protein